MEVARKDKQQHMQLATVKDHVISYVQRTYRHGQDIAISLRELKKRDLTSEEPTRKYHPGQMTIKNWNKMGLT